MDAPVAVAFHGVHRHFGPVRAVDGIDLAIVPGEFFAMLGPSGSGKTTCLRLIAGFEQPTAGRIEIFGESEAGLPAYRRPVNTVFQDYALFPHMSVLDNVGYGLRIRRMPRTECVKLGREALALVKLSGMETRRPAELSGGQRQRVALARALVLRPKVLLLDEPLGALDPMTRFDLQNDLREAFARLRKTVVMVTHDLAEAAFFADRLVLLRGGTVLQQGTSQELLDKPADPFVPRFMRAQRPAP